MRAGRFLAQAAALVFLVGLEIAFEPFDVAVAFEGEDVRRQAIEEEAVVADDHRAAGEVLDRFLERAQRLDVEVVGRLVEQQHVAAGLEHLGHVDAVALAARELADVLLLVLALEVERADIGAGRHVVAVDLHVVEPVGDLLPDVLLGSSRWSRLWSTKPRWTVGPMSIVPLSGCLLAGDHLEQRRLARAVGADHADDAARRQGEGQVLEQQLVAIGLGDVLDLDDLAAEPLGHLDDDLRLARLAVVLRFDELLELADTRLGLGLAGLGALPDPLELVP